MILVVSPRLAGPLAVAIAGLLKWYTPPDSRDRADLIQLQAAMQKAATGGHRDAAFDPDVLASQAGGMKPLAITYQAAGDLLSVEPRTIQRLVRSNELATLGEGRGARVVVASIEDYIARAAGSLKVAS